MAHSTDYIWDLTPYHPDYMLFDTVLRQSEKPVFVPKPMKSPDEATEWFVQTKPLARFEYFERPKISLVDGWLVTGTILFLFLIVLSKQFNQRRFLLLIKAGFSNKGLNQLLREWNPTRHFFALIFTLIFVFSVSLFISALMPGFFGRNNEAFAETFPELLSSIMVIIASVVLFRIIMAWLFSFLFDSVDSATLYLSNLLSHLLVFSLVAMVLAVVVVFIPLAIFWYLSLFISGLLLIINLVRSLLIGLSEHRYSGLLIFLYLCALEIVPVLVLIKSIGLISAKSFPG